MEIKDMQMADIEARSAELETAMNAENADIETISAEVAALEERKAQIVAEAAERKAQLTAVEKTAKAVHEEKENRDMEKRTEVMEALAEYIKGRATPEQRALLTSNANNPGDNDGVVSLSDIVDDWIWTDWDQSPILSRIRKVYVKGNYHVGYEQSATGAVEHEEGTPAPAEENLQLGIVDFVAQYFKKWIKVSDSVLALKGQAFLDYLLREFGHQLAMALENAVVEAIQGSDLSVEVKNPLDSTAAMAGFAVLSDEATNPVVIISKANYAKIMNGRTTAGAKIEDPFNGMEVLFNNTVAGMLVGDLDGVVANFPEGEDFKFIIDETSLAEQDMVKIVGKVLASIHLVRPHGFADVRPE